jgi:hypothetical protein
VHGDGQEVGRNEEEVEGNSIDGGGRFATRNGTGGTGGGDGELGEEGELVVEVRDEVGSRFGPFIGAGISARRGYLSSRSFDGRQWW